jgi:hypothetical protein
VLRAIWTIVLAVASEAIILTSELRDDRINVPDCGHAFVNTREGAHDERVIALGLSVGAEPQAARAHSASYLRPEPGVEDWFTYRPQVRRRRGR